MSALGVKTCLMGAIGYPNILDTFKPLTEKKNMLSISIGNPGETVGLEFDDGKIMLTDFANVMNINWEFLMERVGNDKLIKSLDLADVIGFGHWSLIPCYNEIWEHLLDETFPSITGLHEKLFFVDLADINKRTNKDILEMLQILKRIDEQIPVLLSLNDQEAIGISAALENVKTIDPSKENFTDYIDGSKLINDEIQLSYLVIHSSQFATISTKEEHFWVSQAYTSKPSYTTGAGDHFHSGCAVGLAGQLTPPEAILFGNVLTAIFVRTGKSPNIEELTLFLNNYLEYLEKDNPDF
ncbi:hypothetical protein ES705_36887 [subsurface metagenome]